MYIGCGNIKSRIRTHKRNQLAFDDISFSLTDEHQYWENYWLKYYLDKNGELPIHNTLLTNGDL
jgi:hypothetical protein